MIIKICCAGSLINAKCYGVVINNVLNKVIVKTINKYKITRIISAQTLIEYKYIKSKESY